MSKSANHRFEMENSNRKRKASSMPSTPPKRKRRVDKGASVATQMNSPGDIVDLWIYRSPEQDEGKKCDHNTSNTSNDRFEMENNNRKRKASSVTSTPGMCERREDKGDPAEAHKKDDDIVTGMLSHLNDPNIDPNSFLEGSKKNRGLHLKDHPEMSAKARNVQKDWGQKVKDLREEWERENIGDWDPAFRRQRNMCRIERAKSQREALLLSHQIAAKALEITPRPFIDVGGQKSAFGWTGFTIINAPRFNARINALFPCASEEGDVGGGDESVFDKTRSLENAYRRHGFVPRGTSWPKVWRGQDAFVYKTPKTPQRDGGGGGYCSA